MTDKNKSLALLDLVKIMEILRSEKGCPWDKAQTLKELRSFVLEEVYELLEAIDEEKPGHIKEELGDLLFQVIFIAKLFEEKNLFNINDVAETIHNKLIRRHPHVFASDTADTPDEVLMKWESIKRNEKNNAKGKSHILDSIPATLPALVQAYKISKKAAMTGFEWNTVEEVWEKVMEEMKECKQVLEQNDVSGIEEEFGDILFTLVNVARFMKIDPEQALRKTNKKFIARFNYMEDKLKQKGMEITGLSIEELELLWQEAKARE